MQKSRDFRLYCLIIFLIGFATFANTQNLPEKARFIIINCPPNGTVKTDGNTIEHDIGGWYTVLSGKILLEIFIQDSIVFSSKFNFESNEEKRIIFDCSINCTSVEIRSSPSDAKLVIDNEDGGSVPYQNDFIKPGKHVIDLSLPGYEPINTEISLSPDKPGIFSYLLDYTQEYKDSVALVQKQEFRSRQRWKNIILGAVTVSLAGVGVMYELQARSELADADQAASEYDKASSNFEYYKKTYYEHRKNAKKAIDLRNIFFGTAGIGFAGFCFSFVF